MLVASSPAKFSQRKNATERNGENWASVHTARVISARSAKLHETASAHRCASPSSCHPACSTEKFGKPISVLGHANLDQQTMVH